MIRRVGLVALDAAMFVAGYAIGQLGAFLHQLRKAP